MQRRISSGIAIASLTALGLLAHIGQRTAPAQADSCVPLRVVGGEGTQVRKEVSVPGTIGSRSNWNTDFEVPGGTYFSRYQVNIWSVKDNDYDVKVFLKYSDDTADNSYDRSNFPIPSVEKTGGQPSLKISAQPRRGEQPFQVNALVGGTNAVGSNYTVAAYGCR